MVSKMTNIDTLPQTNGSSINSPDYPTRFDRDTGIFNPEEQAHSATALNALVDNHLHDINDPAYINLLGAELRDTADVMRSQRPVSPAVTRSLARAVEVLSGSDAPPLQKLYPIMEAAAVTEDPAIVEAAYATLDKAYPINDKVDPMSLELNKRSQREFHMALNRAGIRKNLAQAIITSEALLDQRNDNDTERQLAISDLLMQEQDGKINPKDKELLHELQEQQRRHEERQKLETLGVVNNDRFDDAVRYTPNFDDDESQAA